MLHYTVRSIFDTFCKTVRLWTVFFLLLIAGCNTRPGSSDNKSDFHFSLIPESQSNIHFNNKLTESDSVNFLTNQYIYIGSGVGIGDFNNDGLQDIFFAGEQVSCKLYLNKGDFQFEDVTDKAGLRTEKWCTGVSVVDINNDGLPDIYVSVSHSRNPEQRKNLLFINQGNLKFSEQAAEYGLDDAGFSTQAAFFDYDKDGDLDMYLMNHNVFQNQPNNIVATDATGTSVAADKLYRNEGTPSGMNHPVYKDVSLEAGIRDFGYGLGLVISDLNKDSWPDIYVANDFLSNDLLWLNNKNGAFTNCIPRSMHHQSYNSMGTDAADINNDQLPDIAVLDMQPENNYRKKTMFAGTNPIKYEMEQKTGDYQPQFTRNMLQLHQGNRAFNNTQEPFFSEIGQLSGISETDWSWSILMADFDNDGWKDVHVTNGLAKDLTNNDFLFFRSNQNQDDMPGSNRGTTNRGNGNDPARLRRELDTYGSIKIDNYFYRNNGNLTFSNVTEATGMAVPSVSHGAAYGDLDNDGDLDMVINNMNQEAFVWKNELRKTPGDSTHNFLTVQLKGNNLNQSGIGVKAALYAGDQIQVLEQYPVRGYLSSMDNRLHFGIGDVKDIDSLRIIWPDGLQQVLKNIKSNQTITVNYSNSLAQPEADTTIVQGFFEDAGKQLDIWFRHDEMSFFDYGNQWLLPQKYSQLGPALATGDVNSDGLTDFFVGGGSYQSGKIFIQTNKGIFSSKDLVAKNKTSEDAGAVFFDADGDKDLDLLIAEGSSEFNNSRTLNVPRIYTNDGRGDFVFDEDAMPENITTISQAVTVGDYDGDGDDDIFIGGRILANQYPLPPRSYILQNNKGKFIDVTKEVCPVLQEPGLITAAIWMDFNNDKKTDLIICGEWMPVRFFKNVNGKLEEATANTGLTAMNGLWRSLQAADIDNDGDIDLIAGNMGNNNKFHASGERPMMLYAKDIDGNETIDLIPAYYIMNNERAYELFPAIDRTEFAQEVPTIKKRYLLNRDFAKVKMKDLLAEIDQKDMLVLKCDTTASLWIENMGNGSFKARQLPLEVQFAPVNAILAKDFDKDGNIDLLLAGNEYQVEIGSGRYDASYGQLLKGDGKGRFTPVRPVQSGIIIDGDVKGMVHILTKNRDQLIVAAINNDWVKCLKIKPQNLNKR
jgi:enediyne biosynthesis protein E4